MIIVGSGGRELCLCVASVSLSATYRTRSSALALLLYIFPSFRLQLQLCSVCIVRAPHHHFLSYFLLLVIYVCSIVCKTLANIDIRTLVWRTNLIIIVAVVVLPCRRFAFAAARHCAIITINIASISMPMLMLYGVHTNTNAITNQSSRQ